MIIWLSSYPRSGNTFLRIVFNSIFGIKTYSIYNDKSDIGADKKLGHVVGHKMLSEFFDINQARRSKEIYFIKTHDLVEDMNISNEDKVIYILRDGRESSLSFAQYLRDFQSGDEQVLKRVILGNVLFGSWGQHVSQWHGIDNKIIIKFEDLIDDTMQVARRIEKYLDIEIVSEEIPSFEQLRKLNDKFFRSGKKDSWKKEMEEEYVNLFWMISGVQMINNGYTDNIPNYFLNPKMQEISKKIQQNLYFQKRQIKKNRKNLQQQNRNNKKLQRHIVALENKLYTSQSTIDLNDEGSKNNNEISNAEINNHKKKISIIMVDGGFRENIYSAKYFAHQDFPQDEYEIIWVEYYDKAHMKLQDISKVDIVTLNREGRYHSSYCFNEGIKRASGELIIIPDADQIANPQFLRQVWNEHKKNEELVMYIYRYDELKENILENLDFDELDRKCVLQNTVNHGACLSVRKKWLIYINGYEQHPVFSGGFHANGFDIYTRFKNIGLLIKWNRNLKLYHPWHPHTSAPAPQYVKQNKMTKWRQDNLQYLALDGVDTSKNDDSKIAKIFLNNHQN